MTDTFSQQPLFTPEMLHQALSDVLRKSLTPVQIAARSDAIDLLSSMLGDVSAARISPEIFAQQIAHNDQLRKLIMFGSGNDSLICIIRKTR